MTHNKEYSTSKVLVIFGSTATGKTDLAIAIAIAVKNAEIINTDASQVYEELPVATNKFTKEEQELLEANGIKTHLFSTVSTIELLKQGKQFTVQHYQEQARRMIEEVNARGNLAILVGGTDYYIQATVGKSFLSHLDEDEETAHSESSSATTTSSTTTAGETTPQVYTFQRLQQVDPEMANKIHPHDYRKIEKVLKHYEKTNVKYGSKQDGFSLYYPNALFFYTTCDRTVLFERCNNRILKMESRGLLQEAEEFRNDLRRNNLSLSEFSAGVTQCIGYKEFVNYMELKESSTASSAEIEQAKQQSIQNMQTITRHYARKQTTWFKRQWAAPNSVLFEKLEVTADQSTEATTSNSQVITFPSKLFRFDSTSVEDFKTKAIPHAVSLATSFFHASALPPATIVQEHSLTEPPQESKEIYVGKKRRAIDAQNEELQKWQKYTCEKCDKTLNGYLEWQQHLQSKQHRKMKSKKTRPNPSTSQAS